MKNTLNFNHSAPNLVLICIDSKEETGRLYHKYSKEGAAFHQYTELILKMEHLFDVIGYPQSSVQTREFTKTKTVDGRVLAEPPKAVWEVEEILQKQGGLATFLVHVKWRQRATWQGECSWIEKEQQEVFDSELDLLKLLDAARNALLG